MWDNQREFLNGVVRRFKPKKIVEIGASRGCSSSIILIFFVLHKNENISSFKIKS